MNKYIKVFGTALVAVALMGNQGGCNPETGEITIAGPDIPEGLLKCLPAPYRDQKIIKVTPKQAAIILARYDTAHADCKDKLDRVRVIYEQWQGKSLK